MNKHDKTDQTRTLSTNKARTDDTTQQLSIAEQPRWPEYLPATCLHTSYVSKRFSPLCHLLRLLLLP